MTENEQAARSTRRFSLSPLQPRAYGFPLQVLADPKRQFRHKRPLSAHAASLRPSAAERSVDALLVVAPSGSGFWTASGEDALIVAARQNPSDHAATNERHDDSRAKRFPNMVRPRSVRAERKSR